MEYIDDINKAKAQKKQLNRKVSDLKNVNEKKLDQLFQNAHEEVFEEIDCLSCANCCKTTSPIFRDIDIKRIASHLKITSAEFIDSFLNMDHEGDYVLKKSPCNFLGEDNKCSIYAHRPLACREYPHTNRKRMYQILDLTKKNAQICPAVSIIILDKISIK